MSTDDTPSHHLRESQEEARAHWRQALPRLLLPRDAGVRQQWDDGPTIARLLAMLGSTHATTLIAFDDGEQRRERLPDDPSALFGAYGLTDPPTDLTLDYVPHPDDLAHSAFVLTLPYRDGRATVLLAQDLGVAVSMVGVMGHPIEADAFADAFADRTVRSVAWADPVEAVEAAFEEHRLGAPGRPLTQHDVDVIAWAALQAGLQPTLELVRRVGGGGSNTSIHPKLKDFYRRLVAERLHASATPAIPSALQTLWQQLTDAATAAADAALQPRRLHLDALAHQLANERDAIEDAAADLDDERARAQAIDAERQHFVTHLQTQLDERDRELAHATQLAAEHEASVHRLLAEVSEVRTQRHELHAQWTDATAVARQAREDAARLQASLDALTTAHDHWKAEHDRLAAEILPLTAATATLRAERDASRTQGTALQATIDQLRDDLARAIQLQQQALGKASLAHDHAADVDRALTILRERVSTLEAELGRARAERDDARVQHARLGGIETAHHALLEALGRPPANDPTPRERVP